jgi:hypothetical protein
VKEDGGANGGGDGAVGGAGVSSGVAGKHAGHRHAPRDCPVCGDRLALTRLSCEQCGTELAGRFEACEFCSLPPADRELLRVFLVSRGNMKELERHLGVSYPTARARFDAVLGRLGLDRPAPPAESRLDLLARLASGDIDVDEALRRLS